MQREIKESAELLNSEGKLNRIGYARRHILHYNRGNIRHGIFRIKEWDYYAILSENYGIALTVADLGYLALYSICWLDFISKQYTTFDDIRLFSKLRTGLPDTPYSGDIIIKRKRIRIEIRLKERSDRYLERRITIDCPRFKKNAELKAEITLIEDKEADSIVIATPWKNKPTYFYYNQKINCMPAEGYVRIGTEEFQFGGSNKSFGVLDWGRGVWTYKNTWYWSSLSWEKDGHLFGWNFGYGFSDRSSATENMLFYDGVGYKLENVIFEIPENYTEPWIIESDDGSVTVKLDPIFDRHSDTNLLIFRSNQHQVFGRFSGTLRFGNNVLEIKDVIGFAERVYNRW